MICDLQLLNQNVFILISNEVRDNCIFIESANTYYFLLNQKTYTPTNSVFNMVNTKLKAN